MQQTMIGTLSCDLKGSTIPQFCKDFSSTAGHHLKAEALQVFRFGDIQQNGVVRALPVHVGLAQGAMAIHRGIADSLPEQAGADVVRAAEGGKNASDRQHLHGAQVDFLVATERTLQALLVAGKAGRIQDDEVPLRVSPVTHLIALSLQKIKGIFCHSLNLHTIQFRILTHSIEWIKIKSICISKVIIINLSIINS